MINEIGMSIEESLAPAGFSGHRILLVGDSTIYGVGANPAGVAGVVGAHIDSPCRQLSRALASNGHSSDSHSIAGMGNNSQANSTSLYFNRTPDVGVVINGWDALSFNSIGGDIYQNTDTTLLTFSFDNVDKGAIGMPVRTYGIIQYRIDGGSWIQFNQAGTDDLARVNIDFGSLGSHTVDFQYVSGPTVYVNYVEAWDSSSEIVVIPWGARGYGSLEMNDFARPWSYGSAVDKVPFDSVVINIGINDVRSGGSGISQGTYETNMTAFINAVVAAKPDANLFFIIPNDISTGLSFIPTSVTTLATTFGATILDARNAPNMSTYAIADAAGHMYDSLHPSDTGYNVIWNYYTPIILNNI